MEVSGQFHNVAALPPGEESPIPSGQEPVLTRWRRAPLLVPVVRQLWPLYILSLYLPTIHS